MLSNILQLIENELDQVNQFIYSEIAANLALASSSAGFKYSQADRAIRPALVILSSRIHGGNAAETITLAGVFQFAYMAFRAHDSIAEYSSDQQESGLFNEVRFPVLVGDYLYSKSYAILVQAGMAGMLKYLAEIIGQINKGGILERRLTKLKLAPQAVYEIVSKESAEFFAGCCRLGARLAGATEGEQENLRKFGYNLGMAYGLQEYGIKIEQRAVYIEESLKYLSMLPERPERQALSQLVNMCAGNETVLRCQVG